MPTRSRFSVHPTEVGRAGVADLFDFESGCQFCWTFRPESVLALTGVEDAGVAGLFDLESGGASTGVEGADVAGLSDLESVFMLIEAFDTWMILAESVKASFAIWLSTVVGGLLIVHPQVVCVPSSWDFRPVQSFQSVRPGSKCLGHFVGTFPVGGQLPHFSGLGNFHSSENQVAG